MKCVEVDYGGGEKGKRGIDKGSAIGLTEEIVRCVKGGKDLWF